MRAKTSHASYSFHFSRRFFVNCEIMVESSASTINETTAAGCLLTRAKRDGRMVISVILVTPFCARDEIGANNNKRNEKGSASLARYLPPFIVVMRGRDWIIWIQPLLATCRHARGSINYDLSGNNRFNDKTKRERRRNREAETKRDRVCALKLLQ